MIISRCIHCKGFHSYRDFEWCRNGVVHLNEELVKERDLAIEERDRAIADQVLIRNARFKIGDQVEKYTGDYRSFGEVRSVFTAWEGGLIRYAVSHRADGGGRFIHIYSDANLRHLGSQELSPQPPSTSIPSNGSR